MLFLKCFLFSLFPLFIFHRIPSLRCFGLERSFPFASYLPSIFCLFLMLLNCMLTVLPCTSQTSRVKVLAVSSASFPSHFQYSTKPRPPVVLFWPFLRRLVSVYQLPDIVRLHTELISRKAHFMNLEFHEIRWLLPRLRYSAPFSWAREQDTLKLIKC